MRKITKIIFFIPVLFTLAIITYMTALYPPSPWYNFKVSPILTLMLIINVVAGILLSKNKIIGAILGIALGVGIYMYSFDNIMYGFVEVYIAKAHIIAYILLGAISLIMKRKAKNKDIV